MLTHLTAIGDVHGQFAMLADLIGAVERLMKAEGFIYRKNWNYIFLGDYIDRGPDSARTVETIRALQEKGAICLRGNHEQMLIDEGFPDDVGTLSSYFEFAESNTELLQDHIRWCETLPLFHETGQHFFVHAGIRPGSPLSLQKTCQNHRTLLWVREPFLDHKGDFEKYVVHGHTVARQWDPDVRYNRCNLDTGAGYNRRLSAAVFALNERKPIHKISVGNSRDEWPQTF